MKLPENNLLRLPIVLVVRTPIMFTLLALIKLGWQAEKAWDWCNVNLPGLIRKEKKNESVLPSD